MSKAEQKHFSSWVAIVLLNLFLIFIAASLAELYSWWDNPHKGVPEKFSVVDGMRYTYGRPVHLNALGFRDSEIPARASSKDIRIVVLGDSFTWGYGLDSEETYPKVAERLVQQEYPEHQIQIVNTSKPGLTTKQQLELLKLHYDFLDPDLIVIGFCFNDVLLDHKYDWIEQGRKKYQKDNRFLFGIAETFAKFGFQHLGQRVFTAINAYADRNELQPSWITPLQRAYNINSQEWKEFENALEEIKQISDQEGLAAPIFSVLNNGASHSAPPNFDQPTPALKQFMNWWDMASKLAKNKGYTTYDHIEEIKTNLNGQYLGVNALDWHPSSNLHEVFGAKLAKFILRLNLDDQ